jgi:nucleoside-diphosphate-sugar epimerase
MHILIKSGGGFIGRRLAKELLEKGGLALTDRTRYCLIRSRLNGGFSQKRSFRTLENQRDQAFKGRAATRR